MVDESIEAAKAALRQRARAKRADFLKSSHPEAAAAAAHHFFSGIELERTTIVAGYWPIRDELDCRPVLSRLMDDGRAVCLPVVLGEGLPLELRLWEPNAPLYPSGFGTLAPAEDAPIVDPDLILMPLLGFDSAGTRLGYGGGYYDRTLAVLRDRPRLVGFAFSVQKLDMIPREPHDVPLDAVVTEQGITHFGAAFA